MPQSIEQIKAGAEGMSLDELQAEKNVRDAQVFALRAEMAEIHDLMEPKWAAEQRAKAGPAHLSQNVGISLGGAR